MQTSRNKERAIAVLQSLQSGDPTTMRNYITADNYKQYNLDFLIGHDVILNALIDLKKNGTRVDIKHMVENGGDYVALHSGNNFFGEKVSFDTFSFKSNKMSSIEIGYENV
jgi:predicted SnoaL-like aldol condensation-catalyzing enzyme